MLLVGHHGRMPIALVIAAIATLLAAARASLLADSGSTVTSQSNVIIIGGTGDLAAKYLWVSCFRHAFEAFALRRERVSFVAAARESQEEGDAWRRRFFSGSWADRVCSSDAKAAATDCMAFYTNFFLPRIQYTPLRSEEDYAQLASRLDRGGEGEEIGRLVYLAIPPSVFLQAASSVSKHLRPRSQTASFRVVIEKPFGHDLKSATALAAGLRQVLQDDEMLLMDHYAGKPGVRVIAPLVQHNTATLSPLWNGKFIESVTISMTETETCEHRLEYFEESGIIRDVIANHLQLLLSVVVGASPSSCPDGDEVCDGDSLAFVRSLRVENDVVMGQYSGYNRNSSSITPTAASVRLRSVHARWAKTHFQLSAAKATAERKAEVTIVFTTGIAGQECTLRIVIQDGPHSAGERIEWRCPSHAPLVPPPGWTQSLRDPHTLMRSVRSTAQPRQLGLPVSAYDLLLRDAARGHAESFMNVDDVLATWELWTPILNDTDASDPESLIRYPIGAQWWMEPVESHCLPRPPSIILQQHNVCFNPVTPTP